VPLGETLEAYCVRVLANGALRREETVTATTWSYLQAQQTLDGITGQFSIEVAQISDQYGPGPFAEVEFDE
jgi:hypothetical protein